MRTLSLHGIRVPTVQLQSVRRAALAVAGAAALLAGGVPASAQVYLPLPLNSAGSKSVQADLSTPLQNGVYNIALTNTMGSPTVYQSIFGVSPSPSLPSATDLSGNWLFGGVPFNIPSAGNVGVNQVWNAALAIPSPFSPTSPQAAPGGERVLVVYPPASGSFTWQGINEFQTLIGCYWGYPFDIGAPGNAKRAWIIVNATDGSSYRRNLFPGPSDYTQFSNSDIFQAPLPAGQMYGSAAPPSNADIRDVNFTTFKSRYSNVINNTTTTNVYVSHTSDPTLTRNNMRLDMQKIQLPFQFLNKTISSVEFHDNGYFGIQRIFVTGLTGRRDVTDQIQLVPLQVYYSAALGSYIQVCRLTNPATNTTTLVGPISVVLNHSALAADNLSCNNNTGTTTTTLPGSPYVDCGLGTGSTLLPGQSLIVTFRYVVGTTPPSPTIPTVTPQFIPGYSDTANPGVVVAGSQPR